MSALSEVTLLIGQRAGDLEKARDVFTAETRAFVTSILGAIKRARSDPWTTNRIRLDFPRDTETEQRATPFLRNQYCIARTSLKFKRGTNFREVAAVNFGLEFDESRDAFAWQVLLVPAANYQQIDDRVWRQWCSGAYANSLPEAEHQVKTNTVRLVRRPLDDQLSQQSAFNDVKSVLEFLLTTDSALADAVGLEPMSAEDTASG